MTDTPSPDLRQSSEIGPDEKIAQVMAYTTQAICWGDVIIKEQIRPSIWLRTNAAPDSLWLRNARYILLTGGSAKPLAFPELFIQTSQVLAFHLVPPAKDPLDYDPEEPNMRMEPVCILTGLFRMEGSIRMASRSNLSKYIHNIHEKYTGIYNARITCQANTNIGVISVPFVLVLREDAIFSVPG